MRENEPENVVKTFKKLRIRVELVKAKDKFFRALKGKIDPEEKRETITKVFYGAVFKKSLERIKLNFYYKEQF
jgi:GMP synthase (glutamine-hydrolysing)